MELVKIKFGTSLFFYLYPLSCAGVFAGLYFGLRKRSDKTKKYVLFSILALNFALHFIKLAFPEYINKGFPEVIRKCTPENICAVSTLIFPFIYLSNWKVGKDYMFYLGVISGVLSCFSPMPVEGLPFYSLETMRFYFCHATLWQIPLLMVIFKQHELDYRRIWKSLVMYFLVLCVIIVNEIILIRIGWVGSPSFEDFFDPSGRDMGYAIGVPEKMQKIADHLFWMTPKAWKDPYVPILWEVFPVIIYGGFLCLCLCLYWEHEHIRQDILALINKISEKRKAKKENSQDNGDNE